MIENYINMKKIKYGILKQILNKYIDYGIDYVNIFIDVNTLLNSFYAPKVIEEFNVLKNNEEKVMIASELTNIVAHYRHFFWSRYGLPSIFSLYYSDEKATYNILKNPKYKEDFYKKRIDNVTSFNSVNTIIKKNLDIASILFKYISKAYLINTNDMESSLYPYYKISNYKKFNKLNIVITNDILQYQVVNFKNTIILKLNYDNSKIIDRQNLYSEVAGIKDCVLSPKLYSLYLSFLTNKKYSLNGIKGIGAKKCIKLLTSALEKGILLNTNYTNIDELLDNMITENIIKQTDKKIVQTNFEVLNYDLMNMNINIAQKERLKKFYVNINNNNKIMEINRRFYKFHPIMLMELCEGI